MTNDLCFSSFLIQVFVRVSLCVSVANYGVNNDRIHRPPQKI